MRFTVPIFQTGPMRKFLLLIICLIAFVSPVSAYEVWMGMLCIPAKAAKDTRSWSRTAKLVDGLNVNFAPVKAEPGTPTADYTRCSSDQEKYIANQLTNRLNGMAALPRSRLEKVSMSEWITNMFEEEKKSGFGIKYIMFYDNAAHKGDETEVNFSWTTAEVQALRDSLNATGHRDVKLLFDARNNGLGVRKWCENPLVEAIMLEGSPAHWFDNKGSRQELLKWLWASSTTKDKKIIFQIPTTVAVTDYYQQVRRLVRWFGTSLMDADFLRSDRVIFLPVSYNPPAVFSPEIAPGNPKSYVNSMTGLLLSLIEQRPLFEQRTRVPTEADCDSYERTP